VALLIQGRALCVTSVSKYVVFRTIDQLMGQI
jgi:hypothetical protein